MTEGERGRGTPKVPPIKIKTYRSISVRQRFFLKHGDSLSMNDNDNKDDVVSRMTRETITDLKNRPQSTCFIVSTV